MRKFTTFFSAMLISIFTVLMHSPCLGFLGEPDYPEELLK
ncbi:cyclic lactone autoinducer peptide [Clostridium diolis]|nr:cyclic lactone autoinducer peptide [Clostridium diolis]OVE66607.1 cyclic lactone autoinducer peptide [Clostridium diolis]